MDTRKLWNTALLTKIAVSLTVVTVAVLSGCADNGTTTTDMNGVIVGDVITGGFTVTVDDAEGGYIATRDFDENDDGDMLDADDEVQAIVRGRFTQDVHFTSDTVWYLDGAVFIGKNDGTSAVTLTVDPGTLIKGEVSTTNPGLLVIDRGAKIEAVGTATDPIVFTSALPAGDRAPGDWGGIVINGLGIVQNGTQTGEGSTGTYGGTNAADDSGTLKYVQVQFAGTLFTPDNELNGIAFQAVGSGTEVDYVQVHMNADDGVEFFGGSVQVKHVVLTGNMDDSLDFDDGWNGSAQFVVIQQYPGNDYAIEGDGDATPTGGTVTPANPVLANLTIVGPTAADDVDGGPSFKENADPDFYNSLIVNYQNATPALKEDATSGKEPTVEYFGIALEAGAGYAGAVDWDAQDGTNGNESVDNGDAATWPNTNHIVDTTLATGSYAFNAKPTSVDAGTAQTLPTADDAGSTITATSYLGAIDPAGTDWTTGWIATPAN